MAFTPDEEVGKGAKHFDVEAFGAKWAYTVDGGGVGELEFENFNAASVTIKIVGNNVHPGTAKGADGERAVTGKSHSCAGASRREPGKYRRL